MLLRSYTNYDVAVPVDQGLFNLQVLCVCLATKCMLERKICHLDIILEVDLQGGRNAVEQREPAGGVRFDSP